MISPISRGKRTAFDILFRSRAVAAIGSTTDLSLVRCADRIAQALYKTCDGGVGCVLHQWQDLVAAETLIRVFRHHPHVIGLLRFLGVIRRARPAAKSSTPLRRHRVRERSRRTRRQETFVANIIHRAALVSPARDIRVLGSWRA